MQHKLFSTTIKLLITIAFVCCVIKSVDYKVVLENLHQFSVSLLIIVFALSVLQMFMYHIRFYYLVNFVSAKAKILKLFLTNWGAIFISQVLPGGLIVGDIARLQFLNDDLNVGFKKGFFIIFIERFLMLLVLSIIIIATLWLLPVEFLSKGNLKLFYNITALLFVPSFLPICVALSKYRVVKTKASHLLYTPGQNFKRLSLVIIWSLIALFLSITVFAMLANKFNPNLSFTVYIPLCSIILMIMAVPISFAGWGLREGGCILLMPRLGFSAEEAVAISLVFGLLMLAASFPGIFNGIQLLCKLCNGIMPKIVGLKIRLRDVINIAS